MKKIGLALFVIACGLTCHGQFFSEDEKPEKKIELKQSLPETEQRVIYREICAAEKTAEQKAKQFNPVKIHHIPEKRADQEMKAAKSKAKLLEHYQQDIAKEHQITRELLASIAATGQEKNWPKVLEKPTEE